MKKILFIIGSLRKESFNKKLAEEGAEGGDRCHERRNGARAVRLHLHARHGCERAEKVCGNPSFGHAVATVRPATA